MLHLEYLEDELDAVVASLARQVRGDLPPDLFEDIPGAQGRVIAVDGGSAILIDGGPFAVAAARAGCVTFDISGEVGSWGTPIRLRFMGGDDVGDRGDFSEALTAWRKSLEMEVASRAVGDILPGDVLAIDGAISGSARDAAMESLISAFRAAGADIAGVSKRSRMAIHGRPAVLGAVLSASASGKTPPWCVHLGENGGIETWVAMLHPASRHAFRIDATDRRALGVLASASADPVYPGYPYPLARVHNEVALHGPLVERLRHTLMERCPPLERNDDFHAVLDGNW